MGGIGFRRTDRPFFRFDLGHKTTKKIRANAATGPNTPLPNTGRELTEVGAEEAVQLPAFLADPHTHVRIELLHSRPQPQRTATLSASSLHTLDPAFGYKE